MLCHISHVYETGASLYFTVATKQSDDPLAQWLAAKAGRLGRDHRQRRLDHPPPRRRPGPQAVAGPGDRPGRRTHAARAQGRARPDRRAQPRGADPLGSEAPHDELAVLLGDDLAAALVEQPRRVARRQGPLAEQHASALPRTRAAAAPRAVASRSTRAELGDVQRGAARRDGYDAPPVAVRDAGPSVARTSPRRGRSRASRPDSSGRTHACRNRVVSAPSATSECTTPAARGETLHLTRPDHRRAHRRGVPQRAARAPRSRSRDRRAGVRRTRCPAAAARRCARPGSRTRRCRGRSAPRTRTSATSSAPRRRCETGPAPAGTRSPAHARIREPPATQWSGFETFASLDHLARSNHRGHHNREFSGGRRTEPERPEHRAVRPQQLRLAGMPLQRRPDAGQDGVVVGERQVRDRGVQRGGRADQLGEAAAQRCG